jgi:hypothetical protein
MDHDVRAPRQIDFRGCSFSVGKNALLAELSEDEFIRCEDTGKCWEDKLNLDK